MSARILIVDDHEIVRKGVRTVLQARPDWEICGEALNGQQAIELAQKLRPDAIVMDITMPIMSGLEATEQISKLGLPVKILIFTMHESKGLEEIIRKAGAQGFVFKSRATVDLLAALESILRGGTFFGSANGDNPQESEKEPPSHLLFRLARAFPLPTFAFHSLF